MKTTYEIMDQEEWFEELSQEEFHSIHHCMQEYGLEVLKEVIVNAYSEDGLPRSLSQIVELIQKSI